VRKKKNKNKEEEEEEAEMVMVNVEKVTCSVSYQRRGVQGYLAPAVRP
jgi:hypothetical protein